MKECVKRLKRVVAWLFILCLCLAVQLLALEGGLRLGGYGTTTRFLLRKDTPAGTFHTPNRAFYQQFSALPLDRIMTWDTLDFQTPAVKGSNVFRIFVLGSSAIYGPHTSSRILEVMLRDAMPHIHWEVYNAACPGMNSHVMQAAAGALKTLEPDLFLVYMGNNEAVGPFGPTTMLARYRLLWRPAIIRALIAVNDLRTVQLMRNLRADTHFNLPDPDALMSVLPGVTGHARALSHYERNIETILNAARNAGAQTLLCTLSGNKRYMGEIQPPDTEEEGASLNGILRRLAANHANAHLADVSMMINAHSEDGLPGYEFFYDNVHFNFDGNYLAAATMFNALRPLLLDHGLIQAEGDIAPASKADCARQLAWTPAAEYELLGWQMQVFQDPHTGARTRERYALLFDQLGENWQAQLSEDFGAALAHNPDDLYLRHAWFRLLLEMGRHDEAHAQSVALLERHPAARVSLRAAGQVAEVTGDTQRAIRAYRVCLDLYPDDPESLRRLAELLFQQDDLDLARALYQRFLRMDPTDAFAWCRIGEIHMNQGRTRKAMRIYQRVIEEAPRHPLAWRLLDELLRERDTISERTALWDAMLTQYPEAAEPHVRRALLYLEAEAFDDAIILLRRATILDPGDPVAYHYLGKAAIDAGNHDEAVTALREALRLHPGDSGNRLLLIQALLNAGDMNAARVEYEQCRALGIGLPHEIRLRFNDP